MSEKLSKLADKPEEEPEEGMSYEEFKAAMNDRKWVIENWLELSGDEQFMALSIHGMGLWDEILYG